MNVLNSNPVAAATAGGFFVAVVCSFAGLAFVAAVTLARRILGA